MKRYTTILKIAVLSLICLILGLLIFGLPLITNSLAEVYPVPDFIRYPAAICLFTAVIPFSFALYQAIKLFRYTAQQKVLSQDAAKALKKIKYCGIAVSTLYVLGFPLIFLMGDKDDAPGLIALGLLVFMTSSTIAVYTAVARKKWHGYRG